MTDSLLSGRKYTQSVTHARGREPFVLVVQGIIVLLAGGVTLLPQPPGPVGLLALAFLVISILGHIMWSFFSPPHVFELRNSTIARSVLCLAQGVGFGLLGGQLLPLVVAADVPSPALFGWVTLLATAILSSFDRRIVATALVVPALGGMVFNVLSMGFTPFSGIVLSSLSIAILFIFIFARQLHSVNISDERVQVMDALNSILLQERSDGPQNWAWRTGQDGKIAEVTPGFARATGVSRELWNGLDFRSFLSQLAERSEGEVKTILKAMRLGMSFANIDLEIDAGQKTLHWRMSGAPIRNAIGRIVGYVGTNFDVTSAKQVEDRIYGLAHFDPLTGLINRSQFNFQLEHLLNRLNRYGTPFGLMMLDLDRFKAINDTRGHLVGDEVLKEVANRITECIRDSDFAGRLGGDEFAVLVTDVSSNSAIEPIARRISQLMQQPFRINNENLFLGTSIGIGLAPEAGNDATTLMQHADMALYRAKAAGRGTWRFFEPEMNEKVRDREKLELDLRTAVEDGQIRLSFQPIVDSQSELPVSFEALARWDHPKRGTISPAEFIPLAENSGAIIALGNWTINKAVKTASDLPDELRICINLSSRHFMDTDVAAVVKAALDRFEVAAERIELEITESVLAQGEDKVLERLSQLKALGVTIAMDDFGTGYSSLSYLLKFPFDTIKIDGSFVSRLPEDDAAERILRAVVSLGKSLDVAITAEGVEKEGQANFLKEISCEFLQGYHFSKPLREDELGAYLLRKFDTLPLDVGALEALDNAQNADPFWGDFRNKA